MSDVDLEAAADRIFGPAQERATRAGTAGPDPEPGEETIEEMTVRLLEERTGEVPDDVDLAKVDRDLFI